MILLQTQNVKRNNVATVSANATVSTTTTVSPVLIVPENIASPQIMENNPLPFTETTLSPTDI